MKTKGKIATPLIIRGGEDGKSTSISSGGISPTSKPKQGHLGPIVNTQLELEDVKTDALLDTDSPASITSLEFLIEAKLKQIKAMRNGRNLSSKQLNHWEIHCRVMEGATYSL